MKHFLEGLMVEATGRLQHLVTEDRTQRLKDIPPFVDLDGRTISLEALEAELNRGLGGFLTLQARLFRAKSKVAVETNPAELKKLAVFIRKALFVLRFRNGYKREDYCEYGNELLDELLIFSERFEEASAVPESSRLACVLTSPEDYATYVLGRLFKIKDHAEYTSVSLNTTVLPDRETSSRFFTVLRVHPLAAHIFIVLSAERVLCVRYNGDLVNEAKNVPGLEVFPLSSFRL